MSNFSFKSLFKRLADTSIPKVYMCVGGGFLVLIIIGMIVGNMYLNEMLFYEGVEKSVQFFTEEELREYGEIYKELSLSFQNDIGAYCQDYANRTNRAGEKIHYGVYNREHADIPTNKLIKVHSNGNTRNYVNSDGNPVYKSQENDFVKNEGRHEGYLNTFLDTSEFKNGVTVKYAKTEGREEGESNFQDIITLMSMILDQKQSKNGDNSEGINIKENVPNLLKNLFYMSHTFTGSSRELYNCEYGCRELFYYCNEDDNKYEGTGIDLTPFQINPHDEFEDYSFDEGEFEIIGAEGECEICGHAGKGCELSDELCYHGHNDEDNGEHFLGRGYKSEYASECSNCHDEEDCQHSCGKSCEKGCTHHCNNKCYATFCDGHKHWDCPGHFYVCCMGHTDITINVKIMYIDEMVNVLKNGYDVATDS